MKYLGEQIDIHGGGQDLIFPIMKTKSPNLKVFPVRSPFVKYWMHNGFLQIGEEKMSKSLGNMLTIKDVLAKHSPDAIGFSSSVHTTAVRSLLPGKGWKAPKKGAERLARAANRADNPDLPGLRWTPQSYRRQFIEAMDDDFNSAKAMGILFDLAREINQAADSGRNTAEARNLLKKLTGEVMGLQLVWCSGIQIEYRVDAYRAINPETYDLRQAKQYQMADNIRKNWRSRHTAGRHSQGHSLEAEEIINYSIG